MQRLLASAVILVCTIPLAAADRFELKDGDRVVLIGNTLIEREQRYGHWETALTLLHRDRHVTFRNLGWSGDTVWAESRGVFDSPEVGFRRLIDGVKGLKPTVLIIAYGTNESFDGEKGLPRFREGLNRLLDSLADTKACVVLITPLPMEPSAARPQVADQNRNLELYAKEIANVAEKRNANLLDLFALVRKEKLTGLMNENGLHLTEDGYQRTAPLLIQGLGYEPRDFKGGTRLEKLRTTIIEKNRLYFHRWRPQNVTYLFGFRKHEQGKNAAEIPLFDPLVEEQEKEIARLRKGEGK